MKNLSRMAVMAICLLLTAIFTSACGGGKPTPPNNSALYYLLAQQNNEQQNNEQQNNEQQNNEQQNNEQQNNEQQNNEQQNNEQEANNNEEEPANTTDVTLTLTDSLNADKIASADIFYSVDSTTKKSSADDKEISKAEPNADDKTKFTISVNGTAENIKIKAIITYNSNGECLDYFSSYDGVEATNGTFDVDFENSKDIDGFGGGNGEENSPYQISQPRHFANINKCLDKHFIQTADIDFSHLTGLKIVSADNDKDITIETTNEKAPFYNDGHGIEPIGNANNNSEESIFTGTYDGDNHTIDGLMFVNPDTSIVSMFNTVPIPRRMQTIQPIQGTLTRQATQVIPQIPRPIPEPIPIEERTKIELIKNLKIGENSIFFIDENKEIYNQFLLVSLITSIQMPGMILNEPILNEPTETVIENIENNAKIIVKNIESKKCLISGITPLINDTTLNNCTNNGNITVHNCKFDFELYANGIANSTSILSLFMNNINEYNNNYIYYLMEYQLFTQQINTISSCTNNGNITITNCENNSSDNNFQAYISGILGNNISINEAFIILFPFGFADGIPSQIPTNLDTLTDCTYNGDILISDNKDMNLYCGGIMSNLINIGVSQIKLDGLTNNKDIIVINNTLSYYNRFNAIFVGKISTVIYNNYNSEIDNINCTGNITITGNDENYIINDEYYISEEDIDDFVLLNSYIFDIVDFYY